MTQLDLPTISFAHYLDLLKRRTWQVVCLSILGLIIGGFIAMLVPRFYVAENMVQFNRPVLDPKLGTPEDPMAQVVSTAGNTIYNFLPTTLEALAWPEYVTGTPEVKRRINDEVKKRVTVFDAGPGGKGRTIARLKIVYMDTDGQRAMELANMLRDIWLKDYVDNFRRLADEEIQGVQQQLRESEEAKRAVGIELQHFDEEKGIDPKKWQEDKDFRFSSARDIKALQSQISLTGSSIDTLEWDLMEERQKLASIPQSIVIPADDRFSDLEVKRLWQTLKAEETRLGIRVDNTRAGHPTYEASKLRLARVKKERSVLESSIGESTARQRANPKYSEQSKRVRVLENRLSKEQRNLDVLSADLTALGDEVDTMPETYRKRMEILDRQDRFQDAIDFWVDELWQKKTARNRIESKEPYTKLRDAFVPPRPTEPNPVLLALLGSLIGLGLAVGLIFLIDVMQATFKTVSDVERSLALPLLGMTSRVETAGERDRLRGRRLRLTVASAIFIAVLLTVVTMYYVMPTRLPESILSLLETLLGPPGR